MVNHSTASVSVLGYEIKASLEKIGPDWLVVVNGGCLPHIGSTTIAEYKNGRAELRTILRDTHRDNVVGEIFAREICEKTKETVCVNCGIHYDNVSKEEIMQIVEAAKGLLERLIANMI